VLIEVIDADRYPLSPRVQLLRQVLAKFGEILTPSNQPPDNGELR